MEKGFIIILIFSIVIGVFALSNSEVVTIDFIFTNIRVSQAIVIMISTLLGAMIVFVFSYFKNFKLKQEIKNLNKKIDQLEYKNNEINELEKKEDETEDIIIDKI